MRSTLLFLILLLASGSRILCGKGYESYTHNRPARVIECTNYGEKVITSGSFPDGVKYTNGAITGATNDNVYNHAIGLISNDVFGTLILSAAPALTSVTCGFAKSVVLKGLPIAPIRFFTNAYASSFSIDPLLPEGLHMNSTTGEIRGTYSGESQTQSYTVTAQDGEVTASTSFVLDYQNAPSTPGVSVCYYLESGGELRDELFFHVTPSPSCTIIHQMRLEENYKTTHEHSWPGLDSRFSLSFGAIFSGYFSVDAESDVELKVTTRNAFELYLDDDRESLLVGTGGGTEYNRTATKHLTQGRHRLLLIYASLYENALLEVSYRYGGREFTYLSDSVLSVGGRAPSFLSYPAIRMMVNSEIPFFRPTFSGTVAQTFSITPTLPQGVSLDPLTGVLSGVVSSPFYGRYTVTASGPVGTAQASFLILVGANALPGLIASYYSIPSSIQICYMQEYVQHATLEMQRIDRNVAHPIQAKNTTWVGVPSRVFSEHAYGTWSGYILVKEAGKWSFQANNTDGVSLTVDGNMAIRTMSCETKEVVSHYEVDFPAANVLVPISLEWFENNNDFSLTLSVKPPSAFLYKSIEEYVFHIPSDAFTYTTQKTTYYQDSLIEENLPVLFAISLAAPVYSVQPALPPGLSLASNGHITGTPTAPASYATYVVTAEAGGVRYTTTLEIAVEHRVAPSDLAILKDGSPVTSVTLDLFKEMAVLNVAYRGDFVTVSITPSLPAGVLLARDFKKLYGIPSAKSGKTRYTVSAHNEGGKVETVVEIEVVGCLYTQGFYVEGELNRGVRVILGKDGKVIQDAFTGRTKYGLSICQPLGSYDMAVNCPGGSSCNYRIYREDETLYRMETVPAFSWSNSTFEMIQQNPPTLTLPIASYAAQAGETVSLSYSVQGIFKPIMVTPPLPSTFVYREFEIKGFFETPGIYSFTVTCENDVGTSTKEIAFYIEKCPEDMMYVKMLRSQAQDGEKVAIWDAQANEVYEEMYQRGEGHRYVCLGYQAYSLTLFASKQSANWMETFPLFLRDEQDSLLATFLWDASENNKTFPLRIHKAIPLHPTLRMYRDSRSINKRWTEISFKDSNWAAVTAGSSLGSFSSSIPTVYFRTTFTTSDYIDYPAFLVHLRVRGGIRFYVNQQLVMQMNLPGQGVTETTRGIALADLTTWTKFTLPPNAIRWGVNTVAIAVHCFEGVSPENESIELDFYSTLVSSPSYLVSESGVATASNHTAIYDKAKYAFDGDESTSWGDSQFPVWIRYAMPPNRYDYIHTIVLRSGMIHMQKQMASFILYGVYDDRKVVNGVATIEEVKDVLNVVNNPFLFQSFYENVRIDVACSRSYKAFEFLIDGANDGGDAVEINNIMLLSSRTVVCYKEKKWNFEATEGDTLDSCSFNRIGMRRRHCGSTGQWGALDETYCLQRFPGREQAFIDYAYRIDNCTLPLYYQVMEEAIYTALVREMMIKRKTILLYLPHQCEKEGEAVAVCVSVRIYPHHLVAEFVMSQLKEFHANTTALIRLGTQNIDSRISVSLLSDPYLRQLPSIATVVAIAAVLLLVIMLLVVTIPYISVTLKGRSKGRKTQLKKHKVLGRKTETEQEKLL